MKQREKCRGLKENEDANVHLKINGEKLLSQIKKLNDTRQDIHRLKQENQELNEKLSEKGEEASTLKDLNKKCLKKSKV